MKGIFITEEITSKFCHFEGANHIQITPLKGGYEKIRLPVYTKRQWNELKSYLKEAAEIKQIQFKET